MSIFLYNLFIIFYAFAAKILALWNNKAKHWVQGRRDFPKFNFSNTQSLTVWMHCASVGEFEQGRPVLEKLKADNPNLKIVLTFFSPSGYEACKNFTLADAIFYLPIDNKKNAIKFIDTINPLLVLWVKYEFWHHYLSELSSRKIPVVLISGIFRKNQHFFKCYSNLGRKTLAYFNFLFLQNEESKILLEQINIKKNVVVTGDTRFDRVAAIAENFVALPFIEKFCGSDKVLVAGSTWQEDEEELMHYVKANPSIKFIIAPHEVDDENIKEVQKRFSNSILYSQLTTHLPELSRTAPFTNCLIIDNIGMLSKLYYYADVCFVGGGFGDDGIHNILEPAVFAKPILFGPIYDKFKEAGELIDVGGAVSIENAIELEKELNAIFNEENKLEEMSNAAAKYINENKGATNTIVNYIYENRLLIN